MMHWHHIDQSDLPDIFATLREKWDVFAPVERKTEIRFRQLPVDGQVFLEAKKPLLPLKTLFLPEVEDLFSFITKHQTSDVDVIPVKPIQRERVILGALGCDIAALEILDRVYLQKPVDISYKKRREKTALVAVVCTGEGSECFCTSMGIDPIQPAGADALLTNLGNKYFMKAQTTKGERITETLQTWLKKPDGKEISKLAALVPGTQEKISTESILEEPNQLWNLPIWIDLAARCIGCGVCTVLCPTCYCFDLEDERHGSSGKRFQCWDSCMDLHFTQMASGENPRPTKRERVRQRFLHKLSYFPTTHGQTACVGCGRCSVHCPVGIGIREVMEALASTGAMHE